MAPPGYYVVDQVTGLAEQVESLGPVSASPQYAVEAMLDIAQVHSKDVVFDIGSNDGRIVIAAAKRGAKAVGIEVQSHLVTKARALAEAEGVGKLANFIAEDAHSVSIADATVLCLYISPRGLESLKEKMLKELQPECRIVTYIFQIPGFEQHLVETRGASSSIASKPDVSQFSKVFLYSLKIERTLPS